MDPGTLGLCLSLPPWEPSPELPLPAAFQNTCFRPPSYLSEYFHTGEWGKDFSLTESYLFSVCSKYKMVWNYSPSCLIYLPVLSYLNVYLLTFRLMTMEMVEQDDNAVDSVTERSAGHLQNQPGQSQISSGSEVSWNVERWEESIKWYSELLWFLNYQFVWYSHLL